MLFPFQISSCTTTLQRHCLGCNSLFSSGKAKLLLCGCLNVQTFLIHVKSSGNVCSHLRNMRCHLRLLGDDHCINISHTISFSRRRATCSRSFTLEIPSYAGSVSGKCCPDISKSCCAKKRIHNGVDQNIGIRMSKKAFFPGNLHASKNQVPRSSVSLWPSYPFQLSCKIFHILSPAFLFKKGFFSLVIPRLLPEPFKNPNTINSWLLYMIFPFKTALKKTSPVNPEGLVLNRTVKTKFHHTAWF